MLNTSLWRCTWIALTKRNPYTNFDAEMSPMTENSLCVKSTTDSLEETTRRFSLWSDLD
jgi:hypothetical protein